MRSGRNLLKDLFFVWGLVGGGMAVYLDGTAEKIKKTKK